MKPVQKLFNIKCSILSKLNNNCDTSLGTVSYWFKRNNYHNTLWSYFSIRKYPFYFYNIIINWLLKKKKKKNVFKMLKIKFVWKMFWLDFTQTRYFNIWVCVFFCCSKNVFLYFHVDGVNRNTVYIFCSILLILSNWRLIGTNFILKKMYKIKIWNLIKSI